MHRFYLPPKDSVGDVLRLSEGEAHHAARVLRVQVGERVTVLNGAGGEFLCEVAEVNKREVVLRVAEKKTHVAAPFQVTLLQAIPRGKIIESIIEKATELGVHRIVPLLTERVATRLDARDAVEKGAKWQHVAIEAIKQCGALWLPKVETPLTFKEYLSRNEKFDLSLVGALQGKARHPREVLGQFEKNKGAKPKGVAIWIGPEGDLAADELKAILDSGAKPITLGPLVLRVETAAIYCLSFLNYELRAS